MPISATQQMFINLAAVTNYIFYPGDKTQWYDGDTVLIGGGGHAAAINAIIRNELAELVDPYNRYWFRLTDKGKKLVEVDKVNRCRRDRGFKPLSEEALNVSG